MSVATPQPEGPGRVVHAYADAVAHLPGYDELVAAGDVRAAAADLAGTVDLIGLPGLRARRAETARQVEDDGVTYGVRPAPGRPTDVRGLPGRWRLDPLPMVLGATEWQGLQTAVAQRLELLDRVLADLYGPRDLLRRGVVPPEVVLGHGEFLRVADGIRLPGAHQLFLAAVDLGRDEHGAWTVIGDRTQAPSGAGYAMENRRIVSRVMPNLYRDTRLERLRGFFHVVRESLQEVAPATAEAPRVVLLTSGAGSETAFDQAFLSTLLGYPVVSGEDLTVRAGRVFLHAPDRLEPVDVVLRRVDAWFSDPLELRPESRLGVAGLLEAARRGTVPVVNTLGAGVLENPGMLPYLDAACRALLGEPLALPSATTYWCGDPTARAHALTHLDRLILKPLSRGTGVTSVFGWELSAARRDELRRQVEATPHAWCAQEPVALSTTPVVTSTGLEPRRTVLRTFGVASAQGYRLMAGGLARVSAAAGSIEVSTTSGALAKDVWVLSPTAAEGAPEGLAGPVPATTPVAVHPAGVAGPSTRVAEDLFWLGRYAERAEDAVRLLRVVDDLAEDWTSRPGTPGNLSLRVLLDVLTRVTSTWPGFVGEGAADRLADPRAELLSLVTDGGRPGTLAHAVTRTVRGAHAVRDQLSTDTWVVLGSLGRVLADLGEVVAAGAEPALQPSMARMLEGLLAFAGLGAESMIRDMGWFYLDAGRRLERLQWTAAVLRNTLVGGRPKAVEALVLESVLIAAESIITYRRRNQGRPRPGAVVELLVTDRENPRSVAHQLERFADDLAHLPVPASGPGAAAVRERVAAVGARLREVEPRDVATVGARVAALHGELQALGEAFASAHFVHGAPQRSMAGTPGWRS